MSMQKSKSKLIQKLRKMAWHTNTCHLTNIAGENWIKLPMLAATNSNFSKANKLNQRTSTMLVIGKKETTFLQCSKKDERSWHLPGAFVSRINVSYIVELWNFRAISI